MRRVINIVAILWMALCGVANSALAQEVVFTQATDLYYGTEFSTQYNHQLWFTTEGLSYDPVNSVIMGTDGMVMRLDLMCPSATNIAGTYEIVGPNYADAPYKMNKKYTYWTYFEQGGFLEKKLTIGTCTIICTSRDTYTISYDVQEINNGAQHTGTISDIRIRAVRSNGSNYTLVPTCTNELTALETVVVGGTATKRMEDGRLLIDMDGKKYDVLGREITK